MSCEITFVEMARRYANVEGLADDLAQTRLRLGQAKRRKGEVISSPKATRFTLAQMSDEQVATLVRHFEAGTPKSTLAKEYGLSRSSVQRLLRKHRD